MTTSGSIRTLLEDRPDLEAPLAAVLAVDEELETWTFDDVPIESGPFGELVSRGVVESVGDEYRLADRAAVKRALRGVDAEPADETPSSRLEVLDLAVGAPAIDRRTAAFVAAAVVLVGVVRAHTIGTVYRNGDVVLSGNDPYAYRYAVDQMASAGGSVLVAVPEGMQQGEPLMVATLWWAAALLGGGAAAIGTVLAWYPVVSAVVTAAIVYWLATTLTADRRVGLAAVLLFAFVPGHALRTSLGYADHHAFDYVWLAATALALVLLVGTRRVDLRRPRSWLLVAGLGVSVAAQVLAWEAGPLLLAPVGIAVVATALAAVRNRRSPLPDHVPVVAGLALGAVLAAVIHALAGWQMAIVAFAPSLLLAWTLGVLAIAELVHRTSGDARHLLAAAGASLGLGTLAAIALAPGTWTVLSGRLDDLFRGGPIAETAGLFSFESFGFLLLMGFTLVLAVPGLVWAVGRAREDPRWGVAAIYGWYFLLLAALQVRFVGELAPFAAAFAGVGFVWTAGWIDAIPSFDPDRRSLAPLRLPSRGTVVTLGLLFLLVASLGIVQVPVKTSQVTVTDDTYATASFLETRSNELGQEYPANYVLSDWGRVRLYNYFVSGQSRGYDFARSEYGAFASSATPDEWYPRFTDRVGYVVMATADEETSPRSAIWRLTREFGSATASTDGIGHFRAVYRAPGGSRTAFAVVPGAELHGTAAPNATVTLSTTVEIPNATFEYVRTARADANGDWSVTVANPGTYAVEGEGTGATVDVSRAAVRSGERLAVAPTA